MNKLEKIKRYLRAPQVPIDFKVLDEPEAFSKMVLPEKAQPHFEMLARCYEGSFFMEVKSWEATPLSNPESIAAIHSEGVFKMICAASLDDFLALLHFPILNVLSDAQTSYTGTNSQELIAGYAIMQQPYWRDWQGFLQKSLNLIPSQDPFKKIREAQQSFPDFESFYDGLVSE